MTRALVSALALLAAHPALAQPVFQDLSATLPPHVYGGGWEHFVGGGVAVFDCDGDALPDLVAAGGENPMTLLRNRGDLRFEADAAFPAMADTTGAYPLDLNGDGTLDLYVLRAGTDRALLGRGDCTFDDATEALGLPPDNRWSTSFTAWWTDAGPVLAVGHYVDRTDPDGPFEACDDNLILWPDAGRFRPEPLAPGFCALSMLAGPDARGRQTLRISNDRHYYVRGGAEQMWDIAEQRFLTEADGWPRVMLWGMGIASRDLNGDGRDEVMLTSMGDQLLQIAQPDGTYAAAPYALGTYATRPVIGDDGRPSTGWHAEFGDLDNDARPDLFIAKGNVDQMPTNAMEDPNTLLWQQPDGTFTEIGPQAGVATVERSRGAALADFDLDGRLDLVVVNRRAPMELHRNVTEGAGGFVTIDLRMEGANRFAIGAEVVVEAGGTRQRQHRLVGGGHAGGSLVPLHFGIGSAEGASITVTWPDGRVTQASAAPGDRLVLAP